MPQSKSNVILHLVFSTKNRIPLIGPSIRPRLHAYLATTCREWGCHAYRAGGTDDHVHIATSLSRTLTIAKLIEEIKKSSSKWMKEEAGGSPKFYWQKGYGAFSVSATHLEKLKAYIDDQEAHHRTMTFQEEFRMFLDKYGIEYDERYVWD
jgi:REP element-mobilizing transposase RayT